MTVIDVFSKYGWMVPLKDKKRENVANAFKKINKTGRKPEKVWVEKSKELYNKHVKKAWISTVWKTREKLL